MDINISGRIFGGTAREGTGERKNEGGNMTKDIACIERLSQHLFLKIAKQTKKVR
jgi:hypothetical protein